MADKQETENKPQLKYVQTSKSSLVSFMTLVQLNESMVTLHRLLQSNSIFTNSVTFVPLLK